MLCPVLDFFARYGATLGLLIFAFIGTYRLTDYTMGSMANPFYLDLGFTLKQIAAVAKDFRPSRTYVGTMEAWLSASIGPQLVSAYVDTVLVRPGAVVKRGEVLATLDCRDASAASQGA